MFSDIDRIRTEYLLIIVNKLLLIKADLFYQFFKNH